jgi:predicted amidophosphoribosyltransferase
VATADQTRLGPVERRRNVAGAFAAVAGRPALAGPGRLWLVDDVLTTGATLSACAEALAALGRPLHGVALARASVGRAGGPGP